MKKSNLTALIHLTTPVTFLGVYLFTYSLGGLYYFASQISLALFLCQCFILLHEFGHDSFFKTPVLNKFFGYIVSLLVFIPFYNWEKVHSLHHKWTGWRDIDPTTENTRAHLYSSQQQNIINFCWNYFIPLFTLGYRFGIYWHRQKLQKHLSPKQFKKAQVHIFVYALFYLSILIFFYDFILLNLVGLLLSFAFTDIITLSQHAHIEMNSGNTGLEKPLKPIQQAKLSRSLVFPKFFAQYFLLNINLHEAHHQYPGVPCYHLASMKSVSSNSYPFLPWLKTVKKMKGFDFIFKSSATRDNF